MIGSVSIYRLCLKADSAILFLALWSIAITTARSGNAFIKSFAIGSACAAPTKMIALESSSACFKASIDFTKIAESNVT